MERENKKLQSLQIYLKGEKMAEEKESKGSYNLQIKIPNELKDKLEKKAEKAGVSLNQYIMYLFIDEIKNERI